MREKAFPDIRVSEIAARAGVSIGGFYARYRSKQALLEVIELAVLDEFSETARRELDGAGSTVAGIARAYAQMLVTNFTSRRSEILQLQAYARGNDAARERVRLFNQSVHDRMRELLGGHASRRRVDLALFFTGACAREAILTPNLGVYGLRLTPEELAGELARAFEDALRGDAEP